MMCCLKKFLMSLFVFVMFVSVVRAEETVKNVILMIGDGMGVQEVALLNAYAKYAKDSVYKDKGRRSALERAMDEGMVGMVCTEPAGALVADSAAAGTQLATGKPARCDMIGLDKDGNVAETILEKAKKMGKSTGLVSDTRMTHATPAAFAAHQPSRDMENEIAEDILKNRVDVLLSGGLRYWIPRSANDKNSSIHKQLKKMTAGTIAIKSKRMDEKNLLDEAKKDGYQLVFDRRQLEGASKIPILGLFSYSGMPDGITQSAAASNLKRTCPNLVEMTKKAVELLEKNSKGFFLMVEGGQIDWAGHDNDTGRLLHELVQFDKAVEYVLEWLEGRNDTVVIITADHETGGVGFSYSRNDIPKAEKLSGAAFVGRDYVSSFNFGDVDVLDKLFRQQASYATIIGQFDSLPEKKRVPDQLARLFNSTSEFKITMDDARKILATEPNEYYVEGNKCLDVKTFPKVNDFKQFYVYNTEVRKDLMARVVAAKQNVVWSSGTHTAALVPVIACGPATVTKKFSRLLHSTELSKAAMESIGAKY